MSLEHAVRCLHSPNLTRAGKSYSGVVKNFKCPYRAFLDSAAETGLELSDIELAILAAGIGG